MAFLETISYNTAASFSFDATKVEVSGTVIRLKDLGGGNYSTDNPTFTTQHRNMLSALTSLTEVATKPANTEIKYTLVINGQDYFYDAIDASWVVSDGSYSQSSTAADITAQAGNLFTDLNLVGTAFVSLRGFLNTTLVTSRPELTSNTLTYGFTNSTPATISECLIFTYLKDLLGNVPYDATKPTVLYVFNDKSFWHGNAFILPFTKQATFDANGYAQISIIETETVGAKLDFFLSYYDGRSKVMAKLMSNIVPNLPTEALNEISTVTPYSFG